MCDSVICWAISACQSEILYTYLLTIFDSYSLPVVISQLQAVAQVISQLLLRSFPFMEEVNIVHFQ